MKVQFLKFLMQAREEKSQSHICQNFTKAGTCQCNLKTQPTTLNPFRQILNKYFICYNKTFHYHLLGLLCFSVFPALFTSKRTTRKEPKRYLVQLQSKLEHCISFNQIRLTTRSHGLNPSKLAASKNNETRNLKKPTKNSQSTTPSNPQL